MTVMSIPRLPDQITVNFGPAELAAKTILGTDRIVRDKGIRLSLGFDFNDLLQANRENGSDWYTLPPMFDPTYNRLDAENAFWLRGIDSKGDVVMTHAVRLYSWSKTNLKEEVETLRMIYDDSPKRDGSIARGEVSTPVAESIRGRVSYSGALWIRSDYRGLGLARMIPGLSRAIALTRWYPEYHVCFVSTSTASKGMAQIYGYHRQQETIRLLNLPNFEEMLEFALCWMTTEDATAEVERVYSALSGQVRSNKVGAGLERKTREHALAGV